MRWFDLSETAGVLELDWPAVELHLYLVGGSARAAWLTETGEILALFPLAEA